MVTAVLFSIGLGMTGDATVSPTSDLVSENFSVSKVATLRGTKLNGIKQKRTVVHLIKSGKMVLEEIAEATELSLDIVKESENKSMQLA